MLFVWIVLFSFAFSLRKLPIPHWFTTLVIIAYGFCLVLWCIRHEHIHSFGFRRLHAVSQKSFLHPVVMLILPLWQILCSGFPQVSPGEILILLVAVLAEEIFFRGFLLQFLRRKIPKYAVVLSALLFALLHSINLLTGYSVMYVITQMILALICGIYWGLLRIRYRSLFPCIFAHGILNLAGSASSDWNLLQFLPGLLLSCLITLAICIPLHKRSFIGGNS